MGNHGSCIVDSSRIHIKSPTEWREWPCISFCCILFQNVSSEKIFLRACNYFSRVCFLIQLQHIPMCHTFLSPMTIEAFLLLSYFFHLPFIWQPLWFIAEIVIISRSNHFFCSHYLFATFQLAQEDGMCDVALRSAISSYKWNNNFCCLISAFSVTAHGIWLLRAA